MCCLHEWLTFSAITAQQFCGQTKYSHWTRYGTRKRTSKKFLNSLFLFDITYAIEKLKECVACKLLSFYFFLPKFLLLSNFPSNSVSRCQNDLLISFDNLNITFTPKQLPAFNHFIIEIETKTRPFGNDKIFEEEPLFVLDSRGFTGIASGHGMVHCQIHLPVLVDKFQFATECYWHCV